MAREALVDGYTAFVARRDRPGVGDGAEDGESDGGLYHRDTRHLSTLSTTLSGTPLGVVGRDLRGADGRRITAAAADSAVNRVDSLAVKRTDLVATVDQSVTEGEGLTHRVTVQNHSASTLSERLTLALDADFADVFEVRGYASGLDRDVAVSANGGSIRFEYDYDGSEGTVRRLTMIAFDRTPTVCEPGRAVFDLDIPSQSEAVVTANVVPAVDRGASASPVDPVADPYAVDVSGIETGRADHDAVLEQASADLAGLTTRTDQGLVPLAGVPWFVTVFGRDALLTALEALPVAPALARGTLRYLAAHQGTTTDTVREEAPGKVFHEMRSGELADTGAIPHTPYYGSVDATPLWVSVLAETWRFTGDDNLVASLSDSLWAAVEWVQTARGGGGDDPFLYYEASPATGMEHKAWRDTPGSVQFPDGREAEPPIASVEVQGYVYRALADAATLAEAVLDDPDRAASLRADANELADAFESEFWVPDREYYAAAKAGDGRLVPTRTSNVGHCLLSGIVSEERAPAVVATLRSPSLFSGWGVRTVGTSASGYSPLSYHLGSVWPHDTALTALGLARYGFAENAEMLAGRVLDAAGRLADGRLPELFCGFDDDIAPKPYPASCSPQAWSAAAPFALMRAAWGLEPDTPGVSVARTPSLFAGDAVEPITDYWNDD